MTRSYLGAIVMIMLAAPAARPIFSTPFHPAQEQKAAPEKDPKSVSLTGCVDERDGSYVLTDDKELAPIANLAADGFPQEGFAKHLGHKITVRGISTPGDPRPTFKVRSITAVSDTCAPQQQ